MIINKKRKSQYPQTKKKQIFFYKLRKKEKHREKQKHPPYIYIYKKLLRIKKNDLTTQQKKFAQDDLLEITKQNKM